VDEWLACRGRWLAAALVAWLAVEYVALGPYSVVYTGDNLTALIPGLLAPRFSGETWPAWNQLSATGWDRLAVAPIGEANYLLFRHLPLWLAYDVNVIAQIVGAFSAVLALARRIGLAAGPAFATAFLFASHVNGQMHLASQHLAPVLILATALVVDRPRSTLRWLAMVLAAVVIGETAWLSELVPFIAPVVASWFLFVERRRGVGTWAIVLLAAVLPILTRLPEIAVLQLYSPQSHRSLVLAVPGWSDLLAPPFFISSPHWAAAALLFVFAFAVRRPWDRALAGILVGFAFWLAMIYLAVPLQRAAAHQFPDLQGYSFERLHHSAALLLTFGAGFAFQALAEGRPAALGRRMRRGVCGLALLALFGLSLDSKAVQGYGWLSQGNFVQNFASPVIEALRRRIDGDGVPLRAETVQLYPAYLHAYGIETAGGLQAMFSRRYYEYWSALSEPWLDRRPAGADFGVGTPELYARTGDWPRFRGPILMLAPDDHRPERSLGELFRLPMLSLANVGYFVSRDRLADPGLELVEGPERPWSDLSRREKALVNLRANFTGRTLLYVYRNRDVLPRFFAAERIVALDSPRAVLAAVGAASADDLRRVVFAEQTHAPATPETFGPARFAVRRYTSDRIELQVEGEGPTLLVVSNAYSPLWTAEGDGRPLAIFPAYHAFWGVVLPKGTRLVSFRYRPPLAWP
jgi:hypothetical protein